MSDIWGRMQKLLQDGQRGIFLIDIDDQPGSTALYGSDLQLLAGRDLASPQILEKIMGLGQPGLFPSGKGQVYGELIQPRPILTILGGGHIAHPLAEIGGIIGLEVWVVDDRAQFASRQRFPRVEKVVACEYQDFFREFELGPEQHLVIVTRGHRHDLECAREALKTPAHYIGMIGSWRKVKTVNEILSSEGFSREDIDRIHAPIGLDIGAQSPGEIAVSIGAQLVQKKKRAGDQARWQPILAALEKGSVLATIIQARGSTPRGTGASLLLRPDGSLVGTVGGGSGEARVLEKAREVQADGVPAILDLDLDQDTAATEGMICGGSFSVFLQRI